MAMNIQKTKMMLWLLSAVVVGLCGCTLLLWWPFGKQATTQQQPHVPSAAEVVEDEAGLPSDVLSAPVSIVPMEISPILPEEIADVHPSIAARSELALERREQALAAWGTLIDSIVEREVVDAAAEAKRVKQAFDQLEPADRMISLQQGLVLLSDAQFPVMYAILFDKRQKPELLEAIFDDALNRSEDLKGPLMETLREDREHPCFFESARILDIVGEDNDPSALQAPSGTP